VGYGWFMWPLKLAGFITESPQTHLAFSPVFIQLGSSTVYAVVVLVSLVRRVVPCANPNLQRSGYGAVRLHRRIDFRKKRKKSSNT